MQETEAPVLSESTPVNGYSLLLRAARRSPTLQKIALMKPYETGPKSPEFQHVSLERMIHLVESSLAAVPQIGQRTDSTEWLRLMTIEKGKREKAQELLRSFSAFRTRYLEVHGENDFPRGRVAFSAPELAFTVFSKFVKHWGESEYVARFGRLSVYPVPRRYSPVVDSILNFWKIWQEGMGPALAPDWERFYNLTRPHGTFGGQTTYEALRERLQ